MLKIVGKAKAIADLFSGVGTFALPLARKARVKAVEQDAPALAALAAAAKAPGLKPVTTETRDLFKVPLTPAELAPFDAVVLDPPRAGAGKPGPCPGEVQGARHRLCFLRCRHFRPRRRPPGGGGYRPGPVTPIDQFLWSSHIELVGSFTRPAR